jgi:hypothetical protein
MSVSSVTQLSHLPWYVLTEIRLLIRGFRVVNHPVSVEQTDKRIAVVPTFITRLNELDFICTGHMLDHYPPSGASHWFSIHS